MSTQISLVSGLLSNLFFALRAISAKGVMASPLGKSLSPTNMYGLLTLQSLALLLPLALLIEGPQLAAGTAATIAELGGKWPFVRMLLATGVTHYVYNECAFIALSAVHPVTHAVANTVKRVAVIVITVRRPARCPPPPLTARLRLPPPCGGIVISILLHAGDLLPKPDDAPWHHWHHHGHPWRAPLFARQGQGRSHPRMKPGAQHPTKKAGACGQVGACCTGATSLSSVSG